jgi:ABC-2 type transport system permease protein
MRTLRRILHVAWNDLRLMVGDKVFFFWSLVFPMLFIVLFGLLYKASDSAPAVAELAVVNLDQGRWGGYFIDKIKGPGIEVKVEAAEPAEYARLIVLPPDFSARIEARRAQTVPFKKREDASAKAAARAETRLYQAIARVLSEIVIYGEGDLSRFLDSHAKFRDIVQVKTRFPEKTVTVVPSGFDHSIPGTTIQFIMMMVIIYGGITVMEDRKKGILARMLFSPLSKGEVFQAKLLGRWGMGLVQALILIVVGKIAFKLNLGDLPLALLVIAVFALAMAALSIFIGSVLTKEALIIRLAYWAMDALHKLRFFQGGFGDIMPHLGILLALAIVLSAVAARAFKVRD